MVTKHHPRPPAASASNPQEAQSHTPESARSTLPKRKLRAPRITPMEGLFFWNSLSFTESLLGDEHDASITQFR